MMLKLLVGLSLAAAISGNEINPQKNIDPRQQINCENPEVLLELRTVLSGLLGPDGKSVKVPDIAQIKYALTLIKKSLEEHPAQNLEPSKKLQHLENDLSQNKDIILNDKMPLRSLLDADSIKNDVSSNMLSRYELPSNIKPSCKSAFLNLIHVAQEAYVNMAKSPICTDANAEPLVPNMGGFAYYVPTGQVHKNPYNHALLSPSEEALKKVTEYLKVPQNYNSNNVISLLQSLQPKVPYVSSLNYDLNPYAPSQSNALNGQNHAPNKIQGITNKGNTNAANLNLPLQGDLNINLEHAKEIADKVNAQNFFKNVNPDAFKSNTNQPNGQPTPVDVFPLNVGGSALNYPPNKQMSQDELQKLHHMPVENGNFENVQNYINPQQSQYNLYQPSQYGYQYINPYQNQANIDTNKKFKNLELPNNVADNPNNNYFYQGAFKNPGVIHNIYQNALPNKQLPISLPLAFNSNNNLGIVKQANDASGIANAVKLEKAIRPKGQVELTYLLKRKRPLIYQPFYFVKYRLPYNYFVQNLRQMLSLEPDLTTPPTELYKGLIAPSIATEVSPDLASYPKEEIHNLVLKDGALVKAKYIEPNETVENDTTRDSDSDSSEVNFAGGDVEQNGEKSNSGGLNSNQNEHNIPDLNAAGLNLPYPVLNQAVENQAALYHNRIPMRQGNQSLAKLLAALGLEKLLVKEPILAESSQLNAPNAVENQPSYNQEISLHNIGNQQPVLDQLLSPYKEMQPAGSSLLNPTYLIDNHPVQKNPYVIGSQEVSSQKLPSYMQAQFRQETPLGNIGYQFVRPPYVVGVASQSALSQVSPNQSPYVIGTQAALGLSNKFLGNNVLSNTLHALRQPRRLLGGFFEPKSVWI